MVYSSSCTDLFLLAPLLAHWGDALRSVSGAAVGELVLLWAHMPLLGIYAANDHRKSTRFYSKHIFTVLIDYKSNIPQCMRSTWT